MNHQKFEYALTIAELGSFSKAAQKLYISQPALTNAIKSLEDELGVKLFNRDVSPIQLTYAGERYLEHADQIISMEKRMLKELQELSQNNLGRITVGCGSSGSSQWVPLILPSFILEFPNYHVEIVNDTYASLLDQLNHGKIDILLCSNAHVPENVAYEVLSRVSVYCFLSKDSPVTDNLGMNYLENDIYHPLHLPAARLNNQPVIIYGSGRNISGITHHILDQFSIQPSSIITLKDSIGAYRLASAGIGFSFHTPYFTHFTFPGSVPWICDIEGAENQLTNYAIYKTGRQLTNVEKRFIQIAYEKISSHPVLQPLYGNEWKQLKLSFYQV